MNDKPAHLHRLVVDDNKLDIRDVMMILVLVHILEIWTKDSTWFLGRGGEGIPQTTSLLCSKVLLCLDPQRQLLLIIATVPLARLIELNGKNQNEKTRE